MQALVIDVGVAIVCFNWVDLDKKADGGPHKKITSPYSLVPKKPSTEAPNINLTAVALYRCTAVYNIIIFVVRWENHFINEKKKPCGLDA